MDYSMEVSVLGDRISIGEEAHVITLGVNTGFPAGSTAGLAYTLSPLQARVFGAQMRAAADAAEGHPGMPSDEEVNAAAKVFCGGVWNGFDPASMMPTEQFDRFWNDGEGHQLYLAVVPGFLRTLVFARLCDDDQFATGTLSPSRDMSR
ncbi:transcriptional regulator [Bifidobacterium hapali]|uniref:Transcriptional regulator n=1 Tax=Bifidobacterium hapali TaxID=1630172 RepID=A0A261FUV5_9BIFI|nr:transcriptional regulator [Bifidobacterium hapali]OZG62949.1 transcriptional regulator [Bifidobacterium hapali]